MTLAQDGFGGHVRVVPRATAKEIRRKELTWMIKEVLDIGDEDEQEPLEEPTTEFEQLTEWLKDVSGDKLKSTSKGVDGHWRRKPSSNHRSS